MEMNKGISVIVPMYKCESFVDSFLDMICAQSYQNIEIICVLDGLNSEIEEKVRSKAKEDERISCIVQEHAGAGTARNNGLQLAKGKYVTFLDADDLYHPQFLEKLVTKAEEFNADIAQCSYVLEDAIRKTERHGRGFDSECFPDNEVTTLDTIDDPLVRFRNIPWNKLFLLRMVKENNLQFSDTRMSNDIFFVQSAMICAKRIISVNEELVRNRRFFNQNSISAHREKYAEDYLDAMDDFKQWLIKRGLWKKYKYTYVHAFGLSMHYNTEFPYNEKLIEGLAKQFATETPWKQMGNTELKDCLNLYINRLKIEKEKLEDELAAFKSSRDAGKRYRIDCLKNDMNAIRSIHSIMKEKYGRDIWKRDHLLTATMYSLRKNGMKLTLRKIKEKMEGAHRLSPKHILCAGHLTTAGTALIFFVPYQLETMREQLIIENMSIAVRMDGYYPISQSDTKGNEFVKLGSDYALVVKDGKPVKENGVKRVRREVMSGFGLKISVVFNRPLLKDKNGKLAGNNQPVSVIMSGEMRLE